MKKSIYKRRKRKLWYGWMKEAVNRFSVSNTTIWRRFYAGDPDLMEWLEIEMIRRTKALKIRDTFMNNAMQEA